MKLRHLIALLIALAAAVAAAPAPAPAAECAPAAAAQLDAGEEDPVYPEPEDGEELPAGPTEEDPAFPEPDDEVVPPRPSYRDFCAAPDFEAGFLRRAWRFTGQVQGFDRGVLTLGMDSVPVPRRYSDDAAEITGLDAAVLVDRRTRIQDRRGRRVRRGRLARARAAAVTGRLLPPDEWSADPDGLLVPTVRATRIRIAR